jgi:hypothetical protein
MRISKKMMAMVLAIMLMSGTVFSASLNEKIEVLKNAVRLEVNGKFVETSNFLYEGTTYVPLRAAAEALGAEVTWVQETRTAGIVTSNGDKDNSEDSEDGDVKVIPKFSLNAYEPVVALSKLDISGDQVDMVGIRKEGKIISVVWEVTQDTIVFSTAGGSYGQNVLDLDTNYTLDVYKKDGTKVTSEVKTTGLPTGVKIGTNTQVIYIPAQPSKGFNWPYFLVIPDNKQLSMNDNATSKKYLLVEGINNGSDSSYNSYVTKLLSLYDTLGRGAANGLDVAEALSMPYLMPLIPRPEVHYNLNGDFNVFYTHALDRATATMDILLKTPQVGDEIKRQLLAQGYQIEDFANLTQQVEKMIKHGVTYLNTQGFGLEDQVMMFGYSAQGTFDDRFTTLYPNLVKAYASGATTDDLMLPASTYKGSNLIFPLGTHDYKELTGRAFDLAAHNEVARLIFMGKDDKNDVTKYSDSYGDIERNLIYKLWGDDQLQRAITLTNLYGEVGGKGMFILDVGVGHSFSTAMREYAVEFFKANRDSDVPVYPIPKNPKQLEYTLFK